MIKYKKIIIAILIIVIIVATIVGWIAYGDIMLKQVFQHEGENTHDVADVWMSSVIDYSSSERIEFQNLEESKILFELLQENLEYKSRKIGLGNLGGFTLYPEYDHFYSQYYFYVEKENGKHFAQLFTFNISSQENASYVEYANDYFNTRIYVEHTEEAIKYLNEMFAK